MARVRPEDMDKYASNSPFFQLKNDGDTAIVRFMADTYDDLLPYAVHSFQQDKGQIHVECLRAPNEPFENCPFCSEAKNGNVAIKRSTPRFFLMLYDTEDKSVKQWERSQAWAPRLQNLCKRYAKDTQLAQTPIEIERIGAAGDQKTTYELYPMPADDVGLEQLPEIPDPRVKAIRQYTVDQMWDFIETGKHTQAETEKPVSRGSRRRPTATAAPAATRPGPPRRPRADAPKESSEAADAQLEAPPRRRPVKVETEAEAPTVGRRRPATKDAEDTF